MTAERTIATTIHGRYLVDIAGGALPRALLVGFHGYAEHAAAQLERLQAARLDLPVSLVAIQGLHRFYRSGGEQVAASWMTREDRELMIADNTAYVDGVIDAVGREFHEPAAIAFAGFSQGASMAYRAAALGAHQPAGVIALGGDIPPELPAAALARIPRVLIGWGERDAFYEREKKEADVVRLKEAGVKVEIVELDAGHKWTEAFTQACSHWLRQIA